MAVRAGRLGLALTACVLAAAGARAGHYEPASPLYSGPGQVTLVPPIPPSPFQYSVTQYGYGGAYGGGGQVTCSGQITATFVWVPDPTDPNGDPPPVNVIVKETCTATWKAYSIGPPPTGSCGNGLGFPAVDQGPIPGFPSPPFTTRWFVSSGTRYSVKPGGATVSVTCTPSATASSPIYASASVWYTANISPVVVTLVGELVQGPEWHPKTLIGSGVTAGMSNFFGLVSTSRTWGIDGGNPFADYYTQAADSSTPDTGVPVPFTDYTSPTPHWYFGKATFENDAAITCSAHLAVPAPASPQGGIDVVGQVTCSVKKPSADVDRVLGTVQFVYDGQDPVGFRPWGAQWGGQTAGIIWPAQVTTPPEYVVAGNGGVWNYTQLVWVDRTRLMYPELQQHSIWNYSEHDDQQGLDETFGLCPPLPRVLRADGTWDGGNDNPGIELYAGSYSVAVDDSYMTYMLYLPPGDDSRFVALKCWAWGWSGEADWDAIWMLYSPPVWFLWGDDFPPQPHWEYRAHMSDEDDWLDG
jgi:hypothetical protein